MRILITGVPGTGKTSLGNYLSEKHNFFHLDMEENDFAPKRDLRRNFEDFTRRIERHEKVVLTWGFGPYIDAPLVRRLQTCGYLLFWLDGDRVASFKAFMERENYDTYMEHQYYLQMTFITATNIVEQLQPIRLSPFRNYAFKPKDEIAAELLAKASEASTSDPKTYR